LATALIISVFQQLQMENHIVNSEMMHARNLLKMAAVHLETQYDSYLFYRDYLLNERKRDLESIIALTLAELANLNQKIVDKELSEDEAHRVAKDFVKRIRYANDTGYVWINSNEAPYARMIMHPTMPELDGQIMDSKTPLYNTALDGKQNLFQVFVDVCRDKGSGFVNYLWPKPTNSGLTERQPKISYVKLFKPWNWIIGTGLYIDDIERDSNLRIEAIIRELRTAFAKIKISKNSYLFIFNGRYDVLVHPSYSGKSLNDLAAPQAEKDLMDNLMAAAKTPDQHILYTWRKPPGDPEDGALKKMAYIHYFAPLDWYIVASVYQDELTAPLISLRWKILGIVSALLSLALIIASMLARNLSQPLQQLAEAAQKIKLSGISTVEIPVSGTSETQELGHCLNSVLSSIRDATTERDLLFEEIQTEEERHRTTLNSIADAVISTDISGNILQMNPMAEILTGWKNSQAAGRKLCDVYRIVNADTDAEDSNIVDKILKTQQVSQSAENLILVARDGLKRHIAESGTPIRSENGSVTGVVLVFRDVTEEFKNKQKLKDAEWKFYALFEHGPLGVAYNRMIYDDNDLPEDCYFIDANSHFQKLTGVDPRGKTLKKAFPNIEKGSFDWIGTFGAVARTGESTRFQQLLETNGRWYDCVVFQYKPDHFVIALFEITEQRKLEQQLRQAQKMDAIGELAGGIAHDFNNVLSGIIGAAELLVGEIEQNAKAAKYLGVIQDSSERASDLIRKLMAFSRQSNLVATPVDSHVAAREAVVLLEYSVDKKIKIKLNLIASQSMVIGDLAQLQNVFLNLGINASHVMPDGGLVTIDSRNIFLERNSAQAYSVESGYYIEFDIRDEGCGIRPEDLPKIFEPFFTTKATGKGTGLGLAAAFGIVKQHKGAIFAYSELGAGTVFHVLLPLTEKTRQKTINMPPPVHGQGCILMIDDEEMIRTTTSDILEQLGYEVLTAENGAAGFECFRTMHDKIDLVLLDMIMPVMNGRECFEMMKEFDPKVRVILASGFSKSGDLEQMQANGLSWIIQKPYSVSDLSVLIQKALQK